MKSATIPPLRLTPDMRAAVESVLEEGETLSGSVESSLRRQVDYRRTTARLAMTHGVNAI